MSHQFIFSLSLYFSDLRFLGLATSSFFICILSSSSVFFPLLHFPTSSSVYHPSSSFVLLLFFCFFLHLLSTLVFSSSVFFLIFFNLAKPISVHENNQQQHLAPQNYPSSSFPSSNSVSNTSPVPHSIPQQSHPIITRAKAAIFKPKSYLTTAAVPSVPAVPSCYTDYISGTPPNDVTEDADDIRNELKTDDGEGVSRANEGNSVGASLRSPQTNNIILNTGQTLGFLNGSIIRNCYIVIVDGKNSGEGFQ